jgi:hypothetical protein
MRKIYTVIFIICFGFFKAQNYTQYTSIDTTLCSGTYTVLSGCTSTLPLKIQLSPALFNYVSGMNFMVIIDSVNFAGPSSSCPVKAGDTTILNSSNPLFSTLAVSGLKYWFRIELAGTPTVSGQSYPCHLEIAQCLCFCTDITIKPSTTNTTTCFVNLANSVNELSGPKAISVYPNPASDQLYLKGITGETTVKIFNACGQLVLAKLVYHNTDLNISNLNQGVYWMVLSAKGLKDVNTRVIIAR